MSAYNFFPYADEEERAAFGNDPVRRHIFDNLLRYIKNNNPLETELDTVSDPYAIAFAQLEWSTAAWKRIGAFIGKNDHFKKVVLETCSLTPEKLESLFDGLGENLSLEELCFGDHEEIGAVDIIPLLTPYLQRNTNLVDLRLCNVGFSAQHLQDLASAMNGTQITKLDLSKNDMGAVDQTWNLIPIAVHSSQPGLKWLKLSECRLGRRGCTSVAQVLQEKDCKLELLYLDGNEIDDECCSILTSSLQRNEVLETLNLEDNDQITVAGYKHFLNLFADKSSIQSTYNSNHTLGSLGEEGFFNQAMIGDDKVETLLRRVQEINYECNYEGRNEIEMILQAVTRDHEADTLVQHIRGKIYEFNRHNAGRDKIELIHFDGQFDMMNIVDLDAKLMPRLLAWIGDDSQRLHCMYRIVRNWGVSTFLGSPSADSHEVLETRAKRRRQS
eukprot:CAMPEP_0183733720 /NCGR_PEP_ID=MMETSP0737-20130205/41837_1 /TAXON_ID=385413 /ORGANISM="Thalassiosira miniscula, Strain CCMP1093" /LENGTH=442 /DNA_ID=CAMNT_0025967031 /DNA_START=44 /DNA_END=1372 /DNA_ORIENTATION=+